MGLGLGIVFFLCLGCWCGDGAGVKFARLWCDLYVFYS